MFLIKLTRAIKAPHFQLRHFSIESKKPVSSLTKNQRDSLLTDNDWFDGETLKDFGLTEALPFPKVEDKSKEMYTSDEINEIREQMLADGLAAYKVMSIMPGQAQKQRTQTNAIF